MTRNGCPGSRRVHAEENIREINSGSNRKKHLVGVSERRRIVGKLKPEWEVWKDAAELKL
jgi:hypothetical protein